MDTLLDIWNTLPFFVKILLVFVFITALLQFLFRFIWEIRNPVVHTFTIGNFVDQLYNNPKFTLKETTPTGIEVSLAFNFVDLHCFKLYDPWKYRDGTALIVVYWEVISPTGITTKGEYEMNIHEWYRDYQYLKARQFYLRRRIGDNEFCISSI